MTDTPSEIIAELRELMGRATAGAWFIHEFMPIMVSVDAGPDPARPDERLSRDIVMARIANLEPLRSPEGEQATANAALIVATHNALPTLLALLDEAVGALEPFAALGAKSDARYRKRGGDPDIFPDTHPSFDLKAEDVPIGHYRQARAVLAKIKEAQ